MFFSGSRNVGVWKQQLFPDLPVTTGKSGWLHVAIQRQHRIEGIECTGTIHHF